MDKLKYFSPVMLTIDDDEDPVIILEGSQGQGGDAGGGTGGNGANSTRDFSGS